ncbi:MAG: HAD family hydrolase [Bdellovibrionota bacterium]
MIPRAVLFDLDETLLTSDADECWRRILEQKFPGTRIFDGFLLSRDRFWHDPAGDSRAKLSIAQADTFILEKTLEACGIADTSAAFETAAEVGQQIIESTRFFSGAREKLEEIRALGIPMGLITNGSQQRQREKITQFGLEDFFASIVIEGEMGFGKPDLRVFQHALKMLDVVVDHRAWMVGDRLDFDVAPAQALGMRGIWRAHADTPRPVGSTAIPDLVLASVSELILDDGL